MNSNLSTYMGAYTDTIHQLGILASNQNQPILHIVPYLNQMCMNYKIYTHEAAFFLDIDSFSPDALLFDCNDFNLYTIWNKLINISAVDVISINPTASLQFELLKGDGYFVTICNPKTLRQLNIIHSDVKKNISKLIELNHYQNIEVECE